MDAQERQEHFRAILDAASRDSMSDIYKTLALYIKDASQEEACMLLGDLMNTVSSMAAGTTAMHGLVHDENVTMEEIQNNINDVGEKAEQLDALMAALHAGDFETANSIADSINNDTVDKILGELDPNDLDNLLRDLGLSDETTEPPEAA